MKKYLALLAGTLLCTTLQAQSLSPEEINEQVIHAEDTTMNIGFKVGTLGAGIDISKAYNNWISLRLNANGLHYSNTTTSDYSRFLEADRTYNLKTIGLLADFHLLQLRVTGGVYVNSNTLTQTTTPKGQSVLYLDGISYDENSIAEVTSTVTFNKISPYVGLGWGNNGNREGWNMTLDVGLMYHGNPQFDLSVTTQPDISQEQSRQISQAVTSEAQKQLENLSDFPFYPVVMIGMNYSF